ncbi:MAG: hypothetical protein VCA73_15015 [Roseibacillus sp.]|jgi:hypothetical protein
MKAAFAWQVVKARAMPPTMAAVTAKVGEAILQGIMVKTILPLSN